MTARRCGGVIGYRNEPVGGAALEMNEVYQLDASAGPHMRAEVSVQRAAAILFSH